ncbi:MAG: hypothetical protein L0K86_16120 [Actinomycetia bacterium]|nr:hypothetical protein [Actinomycetes bacterium]
MTDTFIKFRGTNASVEDPDIGLGDYVAFTGSGRWGLDGTPERADREKRPVGAIKVEEVELGEVSKAPKDDQLPFDDDEPALGEDEDEDEDD